MEQDTNHFRLAACPSIVSMEHGRGAGDLIEIALVSEAEAACPGARVLRYWEA